MPPRGICASSSRPCSVISTSTTRLSSGERVLVEVTAQGRELLARIPLGGIPLLREVLKTLPLDRLACIHESLSTMNELLEKT